MRLRSSNFYLYIDNNLTKILTDEFGEVHVAQDPHDDGALRVLEIDSLRRPQGAQHGQDVSQTKVVVNL